MGEMILGELYKKAGPSDSLPYKLAASDLMSQSGGPAHLALIPLALYNEAADIVLEYNQAQLVPVLTKQANACLNSLLDIMAREVSLHQHICNLPQ